MKIFRYLTAVAVAALSLAACEKEPADLFSTAPVAPVMDAHADILMTENAMTENVTFSWQKARNIAGTVSYKLYAADETGETQLTATDGLFYSAAKTAFRTQLNEGLDLPENSNVSLSFYVVADNGEISVKSEPITVKLFIYGDYVAAVPAAAVPQVVLTPGSAAEQLELLSWAPARLGYNEAVTYSVFASVGTGAATVVAEGITGTSLSKSVDEWNEAVVAAGAPEAAASIVDFVVTAYSDSCTGGIESESVSVEFTTYVATYPAKMYTPGSHQGWDPATSFAIPQSSVRKGLYEAFVDLTTADDSDAQFKFSPEPAWGSDFGAADVTVDVKDGNTVVTAVVNGGANITVPSGFYRVRLDKKFNTLEMLKIESIGIIGDATVGGWAEETPLVYDAQTNTYSLTTNMLSGKEFKFRANGGWTYSIGFDGTFETNSNYTFGKDDGEYKLILDVNSHPYNVKFLSTAFPEKLYLPGGYQGWNPATAATLSGNGEGIFEGGVDLTTAGSDNTEFKFSPKPAWEGDFGGTVTVSADGHIEAETGASSNLSVPSGYYYMTVDMTSGKVTMDLVSKVGLVGPATAAGWDAGQSVALDYDAAADVWSAVVDLAADQFKVCFNDAWTINRGAGSDSEPYAMPNDTAVAVYHNGKNVSVAEAGSYKVTLNLAAVPNTLTVVKQ